jgi:hypothetical protein
MIAILETEKESFDLDLGDGVIPVAGYVVVILPDRRFIVRCRSFTVSHKHSDGFRKIAINRIYAEEVEL